MELKLYRVDKKNDLIPVEDHPLLDLLYAPNPYQTRFEFMEMMTMHLGLTGNSYWLLDDGSGRGIKKQGDKPTAIWILEPDRISPLRATLPTFLKGYEYKPEKDREETVTFQPWQILHIKDPNPNDPYVGMGAAQAAADAIDADNHLRDYARSFFRNMGWPGIALKFNTNDEARMKQISQQFRDRFSGASKAFKPLILPNDASIEDLKINVKDWNFPDLKIGVRDEILAQYGVPHVVLGLGAGENLNRATADMTDYVFARRTIRPKMKRLVSYLNERLVPLYGEDLVLDFDNPVPEDRIAETNVLKAALADNPWLTVNEVRKQQGLEPVKGGDVLLQSSSFMPFGTATATPGVAPGSGQDQPEDEKAVKPSKKALPTHLSRYARNAKRRKQLVETAADTIANAVAKAVAKEMTENPPRAHSDWEEKARAFQSRARSFEPKVREAIKEYNAGMVERAKENLPKAIGGKTKGKKAKLKITKLLNKEDEVNAVISVVDTIMQQLLATEGQQAAELVKSQFDPMKETTQEGLKKSMELLAKNYSDETLALLQDAIEQGLDEGESVTDIADRIQQVGDFSDEVRAERVARTEVFRTANYATAEAWKQSGVVSKKIWYTSESDKVCEDCEPMHGEVVGIDETYFDKGDQTATGKELDYSDVGEPPLHPNCECYIRPVIETSDDES